MRLPSCSVILALASALIAPSALAEETRVMVYCDDAPSNCGAGIHSHDANCSFRPAGPCYYVDPENHSVGIGVYVGGIGPPSCPKPDQGKYCWGSRVGPPAGECWSRTVTIERPEQPDLAYCLEVIKLDSGD